MTTFLEALLDGVLDTLKMLPFLFAAFLALEALELYSEKHRDNLLEKIGSAGPFVGALFGALPQCGFSVAAANLYSGGVITVGTMLAVFLSTSDEAVLLLLGNPGEAGTVVKLIIMKIILGALWGFLVDLLLLRAPIRKNHLGDICDDCGCEEEESILHAAIHHTIEVFLYLLIFNIILSELMEFVGIATISGILLDGSWFQPVLAALIGLIPNCAASVALTQLYLSGALSFGSCMAGLLSGAGVGLAVLFRVNRKHPFKNIKILGILYVISAFTGVLLQLFL